MEKKKITEEMGLHKEWHEQAGQQTMETLPSFLHHLINDYEHDYGTICHAMAAGSIATIQAMNDHPENGGITGFQAGCIMWEFIRNWNHSDNKTGLRLVDYDKMLFPQYQNNFEKTISKEIWTSIQEEAKRNLEEISNKSSNAHPNVVQHWKQIVSGVVPFGYIVENEEEEE